MVSGLVTSPCDQLRIFSGEAREMRIESKSAIKFARSYGEDLKIASKSKLYSPRRRREAEFDAVKTKRTPRFLRSLRVSAVSTLVRRQCRIRHFARLFHQFHIEAERLQLANEDVERFRYAGLDGGFALDDGLVDL